MTIRFVFVAFVFFILCSDIPLCPQVYIYMALFRYTKIQYKDSLSMFLTSSLVAEEADT